MTTCHDIYDWTRDAPAPTQPATDVRTTGERPHTGIIVVGVDGSPNSIDALRRAGEIAARNGSILKVVFAYAPSPASSYPLGAMVPPYGTMLTAPPDSVRDTAADQDLAQARAIIQQCIDDAFAGRPPVTIEFVPTVGNPRRVLSEMSATADLLVVGARGHSGALHFLVGSTAQACTRHAVCPVLVVPAEEHGHST